MPYANLSSFYQASQRWEDSELMIQKSIKFGPSIALLHGILGNAYTHIHNRLDDAKTELDKAIEISSNFPDTYIYLAQWALRMNQQEEAWKYFEQGLEKGIGKGELKLVDLQEGPDFIEMRKDPKWSVLMQRYFPEDSNN